MLAPEDGVVSAIQKAPQGGVYITVGTKTVYANADRTLKVHQGDKVEAGDVLTNGVPSPREVTDYKGLGASRKYYTDKMNQILEESNTGTDRRNVEQFARSMISKVEITDPDGLGRHLPGDIVDYNEIAAEWTPREGSVKTTADKAVGKYLEEPALYYNIGTRITPSVAKQLQKYNFKDITVNDKPAPFTSRFMRPFTMLQHDEGWLPRL